MESVTSTTIDESVTPVVTDTDNITNRIVHFYDVIENKEVRDTYARAYGLGKMKNDKMLLDNLIRIPDFPIEEVRNILREKSIVRRITTISYSYNRSTRVLRYAAVQFKPDSNNPRTYNRKQQNYTATRRLAIRPVIIENVEDCPTVSEFSKKVRKMIFDNKVKGPRLPKQQTATVSVI